MHVCLIIDNGPALLQTYNNISPSSNTNTNLSLLQLLKYQIQVTLQGLFRDGVLLRDYTVFHLWATSTPQQPLSSFEHDLLHFTYQLKELQPCTSTTSPGETIKNAIRHLSRFRVLTEAETIMGSRDGVVYEPALIFFFSYGLTMRKIHKMEALDLHKFMRSQYKFVHYRFTVPQLHLQAADKEREKTLKGFADQLVFTPEFKKLQQISQKMNRGETINILKFTGKGCLSELLTNFITNYIPSLCCELVSGFQIQMPFPQYFKSSELLQQNLIAPGDDRFKIDLHIRNDEQNHPVQNIIPLPLEVGLRQIDPRFLGTDEARHQINQVYSVQFFVDFGRKLSKNIGQSVLFDAYPIGNTHPKLQKVQKQMSRMKITEIFFPVLSSSPSFVSTKKQIYLVGLLHIKMQQGQNTIMDLAVSYPNFPFIQWITNAIQSQSNYADGRRIQKCLYDYQSRIPDYYHRSLRDYFKYLGLGISAKYQGFLANIQKYPHSNAIMMRMNVVKDREQLQTVIRHYKSQQKMQIQLLKKQNTAKHLEFRAQCCVIYNDLKIYKEHCRNMGLLTSIKNNREQSKVQNLISKLLSEIGQINSKYKIEGYFCGDAHLKQSPTTRELDKYGNKIKNIDEEGYNETDIVPENEDGELGLYGNKRVKRDPNMESDGQQNPFIEPDSAIPDAHNSDSFLQTEEPSKDSATQSSEIKKYELNKLVKNYQSNTIAVNNHYQQHKTAQIKQVQKELIHNKMIMQQKVNHFHNNQFNLQGSRIIKKADSIQYPIFSQQKTQQNGKDQQDNSKLDLLQYINKMSVESPVKMMINLSTYTRNNNYQSKLMILKNVGLLTETKKFLTP